MEDRIWFHVLTESKQKRWPRDELSIHYSIYRSIITLTSATAALAIFFNSVLSSASR